MSVEVDGGFYSHVNYSVTKIGLKCGIPEKHFYSHVNYSVTKILLVHGCYAESFYSHVNYSVTKINCTSYPNSLTFTVT